MMSLSMEEREEEEGWDEISTHDSPAALSSVA